MGMVFAAEGLDGSEKLLLLGYTNYTDPHGYCWPSEARLADDCGTSRSTVQRTKRKLAGRALIKSVRRVDRRGEPISNLTRVNLPLLASMARTRTQYDDNLIDAITFADDTQGDPERTLRGTPDTPERPSDLLTRQSDADPESDRRRPGVDLTPTPSQIDSQSLTDPLTDPVVEPSAAPSARSANDARRATTGSSARAKSGGSAASDGAKAPKKSVAKGKSKSKQAAGTGRRMTSEQAAAVRTVEAARPTALSELLPTYRPAVIRDAILDALKDRTAEQLVARVRRRWDAHGYADALYSGGGLGSPVGVAVALVRPPRDCPDASCEDGSLIDSGAPCRTCELRREERRAARRAGRPIDAPQAPAADGWWECLDCRNPRSGPTPEDGVCDRCRSEAAQAAARLTEQWDREDAARTAAADQREAELFEREAREQLAEEADQELRRQESAAAAAETERLRSEIAAQYPEMAAYAQIPASRGPGPF